MNPAPPAKPGPRLASDLAKTLPLSELAKLQLAPGQTVRQFFEALAAKPELSEDAIRVLAAALPKRECVWWGLACLKDSLPSPLPDPILKALVAVERWIKEPKDDANRRAAGDAAEVVGHGTPTGSLADAAFWSGGSLAPANCPAVPPREDLTSIGVANALLMASVADPVKTDAVRAGYLLTGQLVVSGQSRWK